jgi:hypothetical protein
MTTLLEPDRDQIEIFTDALFRHVDSEGFVSLRAFTHDNKPFCTEAIGLNHGLKPLVDAAKIEPGARRKLGKAWCSARRWRRSRI